jgi:hypothetical protein
VIIDPFHKDTLHQRFGLLPSGPRIKIKRIISISSFNNDFSLLFPSFCKGKQYFPNEQGNSSVFLVEQVASHAKDVSGQYLPKKLAVGTDSEL